MRATSMLVLLALAVLGDALRLESVLAPTVVDNKLDVGVPGAAGTEQLLAFAKRLINYEDRETGLLRPFNPVLDLDTVDLVQYWGYPAERHWVTTDDGYVLGVHRIPGGVLDGDLDGDQTATTPRPVVILGHPLVGSSADWIVQGPGKSLAFLLADEGYDVWMTNVRGNTYSKNHTTLSADDARFWDFSFHEHGVSDLPATIEYVVGHTGQEQVHYVGFSMGGGIMFVTGALRPDVAKRVKLFTALGPAALLSNTRSLTMRAVLAALVAANSPAQLTGTTLVASRELLASTPAVQKGGEVLCADGAPTQPLCSALVYSLSGKNAKQENTTLYPTILSRTPAGSSVKNFVHFGQFLYKGFNQYDYGLLGNLRRYGSATPPAYDLSKVQVPVRVHYGMNDLLVDYTNVRELCAAVPNVLSCDAVPDPEWTHTDFIWAKGLSVVNDKIVADIKAFDFGSN